MKLFLFALLVLLHFTAAVPTWEGMNGRSSIGSLIPGASLITAKGPVSHPGDVKHLTVHNPGTIGNITIRAEARSGSPLFYINRNHLWLLVNETTVYPVNIHNSTTFHDLPMQLVLGKQKQGITTGTWRWKGTQLYYDMPGGQSNMGLYFHCLTSSGQFNTFMSPIPSPPPNGCQVMTFHSFTREYK
ncbi:hypothetical protein CPB84DRAFT_1757840 [Gymnopilus junonius]|uniref:Uncharacterized protein n=1 Tax=Gymnopilus junonius TaxID=109634 RepID=A0A9P5TVP9_GYMJU|nr:hypothetical protein CPB84DRAFT_1757840 [Gymnopilus junonius]